MEKYLTLVNAAHPLKDEDRRKLEEHLMPADEDFPEILMEETAARALRALLRELGAEGQIVPVSGYRTMEEQTQIYEDSLRENGGEFTKKFVALPGCSEHQTGLAIDLGLCKDEIDFICPDFPYEGICQKFRLMAQDYGFVERYPAGKEAVTGIGHEPWHFRYVGRPHARIMTDRGLVLEEYLGK